MTNINAPFLPAIKCSHCHIYIDIRRLDHHTCLNHDEKVQQNPILLESNNISNQQPQTPPVIQRRSREKSNGLNHSMRRIIQKIKTDNSNNDNDNSLISPTASTVSSSTANSSLLLTPRSSAAEDYFHNYLSKQDMDFFNSQKSIIRLKSKDHRNNSYNNVTATTGCCERQEEQPLEEDLSNLIDQFIVKMNHKGVKDDSCYVCSQDVLFMDDTITKNRKNYHKACYCCRLCRIPLSLSAGWEFNNGKIYCERDYQVMKSRSITSSPPKKQVEANLPLQKCCYKCNMTFENSTDYKTFKNRMYCKSDFNDLFLPKCCGCKKTIENEAVSAMDGKLEGKFHVDCFNCQTCHRPFPDNRFYVYENLPYCKMHYHELNNSLCFYCHDPIEGLCAYIPDHNWRFHPNCFRCESCQERLDDYYVFEGRIYCETHIKRQYRNNYTTTTKKLT